MGKKKVRQSISKRFQKTKKGKIVFSSSGKSHLLRKKSKSQKRRLSVKKTLDSTKKKKVINFM